MKKWYAHMSDIRHLKNNVTKMLLLYHDHYSSCLQSSTIIVLLLFCSLSLLRAYLFVFIVMFFAAFARVI